MQPRIINIAQLNSDHLFHSGTKGVGCVLARDDLGDVKIWYNHHGACLRKPGVDDQGTSASYSADLIVLGQPKVVATKMKTELAYCRGVFELPISMTLAHSLNWAHYDGIGECSKKAEMIDCLNEMKKKALQRLEYDRFHFSSLLIHDLLNAIDETISKRDWPNFVKAVERLDVQDALNINPNGIAHNWWTP